MFSDEELQSILRHADMYHESESAAVRDRALQFITLKLREKFPGVSKRKVLEVLKDVFPEFECLDDIDFEAHDRQENDLSRLLVSPEPRRSSFLDPLRRSFDNSHELWRRRRDEDIERFSRRTRVLAGDIDALHGGSDTLRNLEMELTKLRSNTHTTRSLDEMDVSLAGPPIRGRGYGGRVGGTRPLMDFSRQREVPDWAGGTDELRKQRRSRFQSPNREFHDDLASPALSPVSSSIAPDWMVGPERDCYRAMDDDERRKLHDAHERMRQAEESSAYPLRVQILLSNIPLRKKAEIFERLETSSIGLGEGAKYLAWVNSLLTIPFNEVTLSPCTSTDSDSVLEYLSQCRKAFDREIYGHEHVKNEFMTIVGSWIRAGEGHEYGNVIGVTGPIGVGKTTLIKQGLAKALNRPFYFVSLGGASYSSFLQGHGYTYEGSTYGEIARGLIESKCMDPIFYFDELDKVAMDGKGDEIIHALIHLTDPAQNSQVSDRYFAGIDLDLSRALFIFSYNDREKVNPILRDRIHEIVLKDFTSDEKTRIAERYILPKISSGMGISAEQLFKFEDGSLEHLVRLCEKTTGMRSLKMILIRLLRILSLADLTKQKMILNIDSKHVVSGPPYQITKSMIDDLCRLCFNENESIESTMMYM